MFRLEQPNQDLTGDTIIKVGIPLPCNESLQTVQCLVGLFSRILTPNILRDIAEKWCEFITYREINRNDEDKLTALFAHYLSERGYPELNLTKIHAHYLGYFVLSLVNMMLDVNAQMASSQMMVHDYRSWETTGVKHRGRTVNVLGITYACRHGNPVKGVDYLDPQDMEENIYLPINRRLIEKSMYEAICEFRIQHQNKKKPKKGDDPSENYV